MQRLLPAFLLLVLSPSLAWPQDLGVALFNEPGYKGDHIFISEDWSLNDSPKYIDIESIRIPPGWEVYVYQLGDFSGDFMILDTNWPGNGQDAGYLTMIRSVRITRKQPFEPVVYQMQVTGARVVLFDEPGFTGPHVFIDEDWSIGQGYLGIESIRVPEGWEIYAYRNSDFSGDFMLLDANWPGTGENDLLWHNSIKSIRISQRARIIPCPGQGTCIDVFEDSFYQGASRKICGDWSANSSFEGDEWNDRISSITVPYGYRVVAYEHAYFEGRSINITGAWTVTRSDAIWNDRISSLRVEPITE